MDKASGNKANGTAEELLAHSLTANSTELLPHLPYLLQDLWHLGGDPALSVQLLRPVVEKQRDGQGPLRVLDLCCGKGAVGITLAKQLGVYVKGVDMLEDFIAAARAKAAELDVQNLCRFEAGDANRFVEMERGWDVVVHSASGAVLGTPAERLKKLAGVVRTGGYILLDEGYLREGVQGGDWTGECLTMPAWEQLFGENRVAIVGRGDSAQEYIEGYDDESIGFIRRRAQELAERYPDKAGLFAQYVQSQQDEIDEIEDDSFVSEAWLLQKL